MGPSETPIEAARNLDSRNQVPYWGHVRVSRQSWEKPSVLYQESSRDPCENLRAAAKASDPSTQDFHGGHVRVSPENRLRPPVRGSVNTKTKSHKSGGLRMPKLYDPNLHDPKTQDGNLPRPPAARAAQLAQRRDAETSKSTGDRSGAKRDCGTGEESGCKCDRDTILSLRNRETLNESNPRLMNPWNFSRPIHPESTITAIGLETQVKNTRPQRIINNMAKSNLTPARESRREASRSSRGH